MTLSWLHWPTALFDDIVELLAFWARMCFCLRLRDVFRKPLIWGWGASDATCEWVKLWRCAPVPYLSPHCHICGWTEADIAVLRWQETSTAASSSPEASGRRPKGTVTVAVLLCYMSLHFNSLEYHCSLSLEDRISLKMKGLIPDKPGEIGSHVNHLPNL